MNEQQTTVVASTSIGAIILTSIIDNLIFILMIVIAIFTGYFLGKHFLAPKDASKNKEKTDANQHKEHDKPNEKQAPPSDQESIS